MINDKLLVCLLIILFCIIGLLLAQRDNKCVVIITGESVRIIACEFTEEFVHFASTVKPAGSC